MVSYNGIGIIQDPSKVAQGTYSRMIMIPNAFIIAATPFETHSQITPPSM